MQDTLERLDALLRKEPARATAEIATHLDGDLTVRLLSSIGTGAPGRDPRGVKLNSLLEDQEATCGQVVARGGRGFAFTATISLDLCFVVTV